MTFKLNDWCDTFDENNKILLQRPSSSTQTYDLTIETATYDGRTKLEPEKIYELLNDGLKFQFLRKSKSITVELEGNNE